MTPTGFLLAVIAGLLAAEFSDLAPWLAVRLVRWAARHRYTDPERAAIRAEELQAVIADRPSRLFKLITAMGFAAVATCAVTTRQARRLSGTRHQAMHYIRRTPKRDSFKAAISFILSVAGISIGIASGGFLTISTVVSVIAVAAALALTVVIVVVDARRSIRDIRAKRARARGR